MEKKWNKKVRKLLVLTGGILLLGLAGCNKQASAPAETTVTETTVDPEEQFKVDIPLVLEDPTKEVIGTDADGGETGLTEDGEIAYDSGPYGDLGKSTFDALAGAWVKGNIPDEPALREVMDVTYGDFSNKEALTKEILAMPRNAQPTQVAQETQSAPQETKSETKSQSQSGTATPPTKADTTQPTNSGAQSTAPATDYSSNLTPEQRAELEAEQQRRTQEALANPAKGDGSGTPGNNDWIKDNPAEQWGWN